jgi:hypothetical protein
MVSKKPFGRAFLEAGLPAWGMLIILMFLREGNLNGAAGILFLAALAFPGAWGAVRLKKPEGGWLRQIGVYILFCGAEGAVVMAVLLAALLTIQAVGLYVAQGSNSSLQGRLVAFGFIPGVVFLGMRALMALPGSLRKWGALGCVWRGAGLAAGLFLLGIGAYWLVSQPYNGHAVQTEPKVLKYSALPAFDQGTNRLQTTYPSVTIQVDDEGLKLTAEAPTLFYTVTWQAQNGTLPVADGFRLQAHSDVAVTLTAEVQEIGGGKYRSWADLSPGNWKTLYLADFIPSLSAKDENGKLDWEEIESVTFRVYLESPGSGLYLKGLEAISLDSGRNNPWLEAGSKHFWIRYHAADVSDLADVLKAAEDRYDQITGMLGYQPPGRVPITLVSNHAELEWQVGGRRPTWVYGTALPDSLVMLTPLRFSPTFNGHRYQDIFKLVPHELTHLILAQVVGYPGFRQVPQWLNEGLAVYLSGQNRDEQALAEIARAGNLPSLQEVDNALSGQAPIGNSYDVAGSMTGFLIEKVGTDKIQPLLTALAEGEDFDLALQQAAGIDPVTLEKEWREELVKQ